MSDTKEEKEINVKFLRLVNGDDVISEVVVRGRKVDLIEPMSVVTVPNEEASKTQLVLYTWVPQGISLDNTATINSKDILSINNVDPFIVQYYIGVRKEAYAPIEPSVPNKEKSSLNGSNEDKKVLNFPSQDRKNKEPIH